MGATAIDERLTVTYIRVSTEEQALKGYSLPEQEDQCRAYARAKQWDQPARVYADEGVSGTTRDRDGLTQLLTDARAGKITRVIFTRLDRMGRTAKLILDLDEELESYGVQRVYIKEGIDTTSIIGRFLRTILAAVAELERDKIVESTAEGRRRKAKRGEVWVTRYGYRRLDREPWLELDPSEAPVVERIFTEVADGTPAMRLAVQLTAEGIPAPKGGPTWHHTIISKIVMNPCYYGQHAYGVTLNKTVNGRRHIQPNSPENVITTPVPAIVSKPLWDAANARLASNRIRARRNNKHDDLLRGLVICGAVTQDGDVCDRKMSPERNGNYRQYRCTHTISTGALKHHNVNAEALEQAVWAAIVERLKDPSLVTDHVKSLATDSTARAEWCEQEIARLEREAEQLQGKQTNLVKALAEGTIIPRARIEAEYAELDTRRHDLVARIGELSAQRDDAWACVLPVETVKDACAVLTQGIDNLAVAEQRRVIELVVTGVVATTEKATVTGVLPEVSADAVVPAMPLIAGRSRLDGAAMRIADTRL